MTPKVKIIHLVWASRGDYSDRNEYPVCWFPTEDEAKAYVENTNKLSEVLRLKVGKIPWERRTDAITEAQKQLGDDQWNYSDETTYTTCPLERGTL